MGIVEVPGAGAGGDEGKNNSEWGEPGGEAKGLASTDGQGVLRSAPRQGDGDDSQHGHDREPVGDRPEQRGDEVAVAVHVGVGIGGGLADEVEAVLPSEAVEDGHQHEKPNDNGVAHKLV